MYCSKVSIFLVLISFCFYCGVRSDSQEDELDSLVHNWPMSSLKDIKGNADLYGGANYTLTCDRFKIKSSAFYFTHGYVQIPPGYYFSGEEFTISLWFQLISYQTFSALINFGNGQEIDEIDLTMNDTLNKIGMEFLPEKNIIYQVQASPIELKKWYQVAFVYRESIGKFYINGKKVDSAPFEKPDMIFRAFNYIGKSNWPSDFNADAIIDEIKIYEKALSSRKIYKMFLKGSLNGLLNFVILLKLNFLILFSF